MDCELENIKELQEIIKLKNTTMRELNLKLFDFTKASIEYNNAYNEKLTTLEFDTLIKGRVTDASKKAYIENILKEKLASKKELEVKCEQLKNQIKVLDDRIRLYEYAIKYYQK